jgi:hypothetical protein
VARELTENQLQRVIAVKAVVAEAQREQGCHRLDPAHDQSDDIERGLVSVVQVLEYEHAWCASAQLGEHRPGDVVGPRVAFHQHGELTAAPTSAAGSISGPSGRGVKSGSQVPHRTDAAGPRRAAWVSRWRSRWDHRADPNMRQHDRPPRMARGVVDRENAGPNLEEASDERHHFDRERDDRDGRGRVCRRRPH